MGNLLSEGAFELIVKFRPDLIEPIRHGLQSGKTPTKIANQYARLDMGLAGLIELAADYIVENENEGKIRIQSA
jgi:hypothetical protein